YLIYIYTISLHDALPISSSFDGTRCDVYYRGSVSPDFYGWVFPHGDTVSVGTGSARKGFSLRESVGGLRDAAGLGTSETIRRERSEEHTSELQSRENLVC